MVAHYAFSFVLAVLASKMYQIIKCLYIIFKTYTLWLCLLFI